MCHYGCYLNKRCMGDDRDEVIAFLGERGETNLDQRSDAELNALLTGYFDLDYSGPDHVRKGK
jgi:hypothetical protein